MALFLSSSQSSVLEPVRQNRWMMQFTRVPGNISGNGPSKLAFAAHTAAQPTLTISSQEHHRLNERFYTAGKPEWGEVSVEFYDYIDGEDSVGNIMWEWASSIYNPVYYISNSCFARPSWWCNSCMEHVLLLAN